MMMMFLSETIATDTVASPALKSENGASETRGWPEVFRNQHDTEENQEEGITTTNLSLAFFYGQPCELALLWLLQELM